MSLKHIHWASYAQKSPFMQKHFMELRDRLIVIPLYTRHHWMHVLHITLG
jgi:hypothetical protein